MSDTIGTEEIGTEEIGTEEIGTEEIGTEEIGTEETPSLQAQTMELGKTLKAIADRDPSGTPTPQAAAVFAGWLAAAGPTSREPAYLADVADNYDVFLNTNKDLFELFDILDNYIEVDDEDAPPAPRTYIGLPMSS